jgi:hypothetical protein
LSFEGFLSQIKSDNLRAVALHWQAAREDRLMPGWGDIDPTEIVRQLPLIWSWRYDRETEKFTGRLSGEEINHAFGRSLRGMAMEEFFAPDQFENIYRRHRRVVTEPCFAHGTGAVFIHAGRFGEGERIIMPLAADGLHGDGIIGATQYRYFSEAPQSRATQEEVTYTSL